MKLNEEMEDSDLQQAKKAILRLEYDLVNLQAKYEAVLAELTAEREKHMHSEVKPKNCKNCINSSMMNEGEYFCNVIGRSGVTADPDNNGINCMAYQQTYV